MTKDQKAERADRIAEAAYQLIEEKGFKGTSMLAIARRARASNETLYNWYGDKLGLFAMLIERNARDVRDLLTESIESAADPLETLAEVGPRLLELLTGQRAIALNRAAAGDATGTLGRTLAKEGREQVLPLLQQVIESALQQGAIRCPDPEEVLEVYISLLVGDLQIRRATGACNPPTKAEITARSDRALALVRRLYGA